MHALLIALTGTVVALGVNTMRPNAAALPAVSASHPDTPAASRTIEDVLAIAVQVPVGGKATVQDLLHRFAGELGLPLAIDPDALAQLGVDPEHEVAFDADHPATATLSGVLRRLQELSGHSTASLASEIRLTAAVLDSELVVTSRYTLDRLTTTRRVYPLARFTDDPSDASQARDAYEQLLHAVMEHVLPDHWHDRGGDLATATVLGSSLIVTAPERVHEQVGALLDELHDQRVDQAAQRAASIASQQASAADQHQLVMDRLKHEYARASSSYLEAMSELNRLRRERNELMVQPAQQANDEKDLGPHLDRIDAEIRSFELQSEEQGARMRYLRSRLIASEYEHLFSEMPSSHQPPVALPPQAMRLEGAVRHPGDFEIPVDGINLRRFIAAAGGLADSRSIQSGRIHIQRDGTLFATVKVEDLSGEGGLIELRAGDRVVVSVPGQN